MGNDDGDRLSFLYKRLACTEDFPDSVTSGSASDWRPWLLSSENEGENGRGSLVFAGCHVWKIASILAVCPGSGTVVFNSAVNRCLVLVTRPPMFPWTYNLYRDVRGLWPWVILTPGYTDEGTQILKWRNLMNPWPKHWYTLGSEKIPF